MLTSTRRWAGNYLVVWLLPIAILLAWQFAVQFELIPKRMLPMPTAVIEAASKLVRSGELFEHLATSAGRAFTGLAIGGGLAFVVGLLTGIFAPIEKTLDSTLQMIRTVPNLALTPLVILWFGIGDVARIFLISLGVFFPIYLNTFHGVRHVDRGLVEMGQSYGLSRWGLFHQIILPGALPSVLVGLRYSLGIMWLTLIVAETIAASSGIGFMTQSAREFMQTDIMFFAVILYALLGKLADVIARTLESRLLQWHPNYRTT